MHAKLIAFTSTGMLSGKTTAAEYTASLVRRRGFDPLLTKVADPIYDIAKLVSQRIAVPFNKPQYRKLMQLVGTDWARETFGPTFWIDLWEADNFEAMLGAGNVIIVDDIRFNEEAQVIRRHGGKIIQIVSSETERAKRGPLVGAGHASEAGIDAEHVYASVRNNGSIEDLQKSLDIVLEGIL
jgi:hypothetical protein